MDNESLASQWLITHRNDSDIILAPGEISLVNQVITGTLGEGYILHDFPFNPLMARFTFVRFSQAEPRSGKASFAPEGIFFLAFQVHDGVRA